MKKHRYVFLALSFMILIMFSVVGPAYAVNNCLDFDGDNDYVEADTTYSFGENASFTIEAWVKIDALEEVNFATVNNRHLAIGMNSSDEFIGISYTNSVQIHNSYYQLKTGVWYHLAAVFSGGNSTLYVNGVSQGSNSNANSERDNTPIYVGRGYVTGSFTYLNGQLDEVRFWEESRTEQEIRDNMHQALPNPTSEANLLLYYPFNESSGITADNAQGSTAYDGELKNMTGNGWGPSAAFFGPKYCLKFDGAGSGDYVNCGTDNTNTSTITLESWVYLTHDVTNYDRILLKSYDGGLTLSDACFALSINNSERPVFTVGGTQLSAPDSISQNEWHHIAGTFDKDAGSDQMKLYVDGMLSATGTRSSAVPTSDYAITLGASYTGSSGDYYLDGRLDEVRIWNRTLSATEIRGNMFQTMIGDGSKLLHYWNFDMTEGDTLPDYDQGGGTDGTLMNMENADWIKSSAFTTWLNTGSSAWSTAANWSGASVPGSSGNVGVYSYTGGTDVSLSNAPTLNHMLLGDSSAMTLSSDLTVNGNLILESNLDLNDQTITLGASAMLIEDDGILAGSSGTIKTTRTYGEGDLSTAENVAGLGAEISTGVSLGITTITRGVTAQTGFSDYTGINRYYDINPANNPGEQNATLVFHYDDSELNGCTEEDLILYKSTDSGSTWIEINAALDISTRTLTASNLDSFSRWTAGDSDSPLLVELVSFAGKGLANSVRIEWETGSEIDNAGFHLWRSQAKDGEYTRITDALIPSEGGGARGAYYTYEDANVMTGTSYFYKLESIENTGLSRKYGPVSAWPGFVDIKANGADGPITISEGQALSVIVEIQVDAEGGIPMEYWIAADTPFGWYSHVKGWREGIRPAWSGPLVAIKPVEILNTSLSRGAYIFYFALDDQPNGQAEPTWMDAVDVTVE